MEDQNKKIIENYTDVIQANPGDYEAYYRRGMAYMKNGDNDSALADFTEALRLKPDFAEARLELGNVYANMGDRKKAILEFQQATNDEQYAERLKKDFEIKKDMGWD